MDSHACSHRDPVRFQVGIGKELFKIPPNLSAFQARMAARPGISAFIEAGRVPPKLTGSPKEGEVLEIIKRVWAAEEEAAAAPPA